jgi:tetratricopeptide (TPR) repeat protein
LDLLSLGEYAEARQSYQESLTTCKELGDRRGVAVRLVNLGPVANAQGEYQEAKRLYQWGLAVYKELDDRRNVATTLGNLGVVAEKLGEYAEAERLHRQSLMVSREAGDRYETANGLNNLGFALCALAEYHEAEKCFREALMIAADTQAASVTLEALVGIAMLLTKEEEKDQALELVGYVIHHPALHGEIQSRAEQLFSELKSHFTPRTFAVVQERGKEREFEYFTRLYASSQSETQATS